MPLLAVARATLSRFLLRGPPGKSLKVWAAAEWDAAEAQSCAKERFSLKGS